MHVSSPEQADFFIEALAILAERQRSRAADFASLKVLGRLPGAITTTGEPQESAPVDHVTRTNEVASFTQRDDLGSSPKVLVRTGRMSEEASAGFLAAGWRSIAVTYVPVDSPDFRDNYGDILATRAGVGAPLVAISEENRDARKPYDTCIVMLRFSPSAIRIRRDSLWGDGRHEIEPDRPYP